MQRTVQVLTDECATVSETLDSLGDALNLVTQSGGSGGGSGGPWGGGSA